MPGEETILKLVRCDRVNVRPVTGLGGKSWGFMLQGPNIGDLWLTQSGEMGFAKTSWYSSEWRVPIKDVTASEVSRDRALKHGAGAYPWRVIEIAFESGRYIVYFTGITEFRSTADNLISKIPGIHHAGAATMDAKSFYKNRGTRERAKAAREVWWKLLSKETSPAELPLLENG
jgi:hypothetical protein